MSDHAQPVLLQGSIEYVTYHNPDNGYSVLKVRSRGQRDLVTLVGHLSSVTPGESVEGTGHWTQHRDFGLQFQAQSLRTIHPSTLEGIEKYLGSGLIKGIGPHFAKKLVNKFKMQVFEVIEKAPEALKKVAGIGPVRLQKIKAAWQEQKAVREIMVFLQSHGVSTSKAVRIYKTYGEQAVDRVKANPYQLARDVDGIGFKSADRIATSMGIAKDSMVRARAGIHFVLAERVHDGHSAYPEEELLQESSQLLEIDETILREALSLELGENRLHRERIEEKDCIYPASLLHYETETANLLRELAGEKGGKVPWGPIDFEKVKTWLHSSFKLDLAARQEEAVQKALTSKVLVVTGGPGTGKTTITRAIVAVLKKKRAEIALCSPTGRAAKRLSEVTGCEARTIHRLLKYDRRKGGFLHDVENPLPIDLVILDESSMVDIALMYSLLKAIPRHAALILVGDVDQIPSVGPGHVLKAIIDSDAIPVVRLVQIFRQAAQSEIIQNAHWINEGRMPDLEKKDKNSDFHFIVSDDPEATVPKIVDLVKNRIPKAFGLDPVRDVQVLTPMNRGILGTRSLNVELQKALNPNPAVKVERFGIAFSPGDKVMVTLNDYDKEVFNGDIGFVQSVDPNEQEMVIDFDGREVTFDFNDLDLLSLAYATTIHKSQGSEYPAVVIPIVTQHYMMLKRNLVYTGVTRGKRLVVMIGQKKALAIAIKTPHQGRRWNKLSERLRQDALRKDPRPDF